MPDIEVEVSVSVDVTCDGCGRELEAKADGTNVYVQPCEVCVSAERKEAYDEGYSDGEDAGREAGGH